MSLLSGLEYPPWQVSFRSDDRLTFHLTSRPPIPFLFYYRPLLLNGPWPVVLITIASCILGLIVSACFLERFLFTKANLYELPLLGLSAVLLLWPALSLNLLGFLILGCVSFTQKRRIVLRGTVVSRLEIPEFE